MLDYMLEEPCEKEESLSCLGCNGHLNTFKGKIECEECFAEFSWEDFKRDFSFQDESICF